MSEIRHTTLKGELLYLLGRASAPLSGPELYEKSELADEIVQVSKAIGNLLGDGKIVRGPGDGRARYTLAPGAATPAPAGKNGRSKAVRADDAARMDTASPTVRAEPAEGSPRQRRGPTGVPLAGAVEACPAAVEANPDDHLAGAGKEIGSAASLADAIIARLKRQLAPVPHELAALADGGGLAITVHIDQVDIHLGGL